MGVHTIITELFLKLNKQKVSKSLLFAAEIFVFIASCITVAAVVKLHPIPLTMFLVISQPLFIAGIVLCLAVSIAHFLAKHGTSHMKFAPGEIIFQQGDKGEFVYTITEGNVDIIIENTGGEEKVVARLGQGSYFGEMALISDEPRMATAKAITTVKVMTISKRDFKNLHTYMPALKENIEKVIQARRAEDAQVKK